MLSGIYQIKNKITNKFYIGSSNNIKKRFNKHKNDLKNNKHHSIYLQNSWNKYGENLFEFNILNFCNVSDLLEFEQIFLDNFYNKGILYNTNPIANKPPTNNRKGFKHSKETKELLSKKIKGTKIINEIRSAKISEALKKRKRKKETFNKISDKLKSSLWNIKDIIYSRYKNGETVYKLAKEYNCTRQLIYKILKTH